MCAPYARRCRHELNLRSAVEETNTPHRSDYAGCERPAIQEVPGASIAARLTEGERPELQWPTGEDGPGAPNKTQESREGGRGVRRLMLPGPGDALPRGGTVPSWLSWRDGEGTGNGLGRTWGPTSLTGAKRLRWGAEGGAPGTILNRRQGDKVGRVHGPSGSRGGALVERP
ncbi:hypothetical protein NDU88_000521 [Pleurodeles waltl]|uniref:Uncharacterized protein n=1 Tax=Pleurodeles waltl TaxID=8319 RepID=A0AAV7S4U8_PLEWA|nr:hypothetical protein NDU88_000521 [Pleurodeles waltl]